MHEPISVLLLLPHTQCIAKKKKIITNTSLKLCVWKESIKYLFRVEFKYIQSQIELRIERECVRFYVCINARGKYIQREKESSSIPFEVSL